MMKYVVAGLLAAFLAGVAVAQDAPKPGPEYDYLKKMVGKWDTVMTVAGAESKGTAAYAMDLGGLWLTSTLESELFGQKFSGRGLDSYDSGKKKYISVWVDNMTTLPVVMEGTLDAATKTMTMTGEGPGMDRKPTKYKSVTAMPNDDTINFTMFLGDGKEPMINVVYKRKK